MSMSSKNSMNVWAFMDNNPEAMMWIALVLLSALCVLGDIVNNQY